MDELLWCGSWSWKWSWSCYWESGWLLLDRSLFVVLALIGVFPVERAISVGGLVDDGWWCDCDAFASWLETEAVSAIFDYTNFSSVVSVAVFAFYFTVRKLGFNFEGSIATFVSICVGTIFVVPIIL